MLRLCVALLVAVILPSGAWSAQVPEIQAHVLTKAPKIDGEVNAEEWAGVPSVTGFIDPYTGKPVDDQTVAYLAFDKDAIYVAMVARDSKPEGIVAREITPGSDFDGEDSLEFTINPLGNRSYEGESEFEVNALNTQTEDIAGGRSSKLEWRGEWQSAVKRTSDGWSVEMRIPWRILNYPPGRIDLDINFNRYQARTKIRSEWANRTPSGRPELNGICRGVLAPEKPSTRPQFLAYAAPELDGGDVTIRSGVDIRYPFTEQLTGLLSFNPDFRNIEGQIAGIDFTRTERYLEDARPFFTEGSGFFSPTGSFGFGRMFYSQRIGDIDYGAKVFGKIDQNWSVSGLVTVETGHRTTTLAQLQRRFDAKHTIKAYAITDDHRDGKNESYGYNFNGSRGNYGYGLSTAAEKSDGQAQHSAFDTYLEYSVPRFFAIYRQMWIDPGFNPTLGFIPWTDRKGSYLFAEHSSQYRTGPLESLYSSAFVSEYETYAGRIQEQSREFGVSVVNRKDMRFGYNRTSSQFDEGLDNIHGFSATVNQSNRFRRTSLYAESGTRQGRPSNFLSLNGSYRVFGRLDLSLGQSFFNFDGNSTLSTVGLGLQIDRARSISGRVVSRNGNTNAYFAYRNSGFRGTELYVIVGDPNADRSQSRISVKLVWAF